MSNEIDKKIQVAIEQQAGYGLSVFCTRFNASAADAVEVFQKVHAMYGRYMTQDYCIVMLGLAKYRVEKALNQRA